MQQTKTGFTLIELLVVVLIIGILASTALPQYQKAVEKSRATQALSLLKSVGANVELYYQTQGTCPTKLSDLEVSFPQGWTGHTRAFQSNAVVDSQSNKDWSLEISTGAAGNRCQVAVTRLTGPYHGAAWMYDAVSPDPNSLHCVEVINLSNFAFTAAPGSYCVKLFRGTHTGGQDVRMYNVP